VAHHSFAPGPTWTAEDGSVVKASKAAAAPAPADAGSAIAWVLLKATATSGTGMFSDVTYVQRVDTAGGVGPSGSCDPASADAGVVSSPYSATYYFFTGGNVSDAGAD
jgi:hypothetical protein